MVGLRIGVRQTGTPLVGGLAQAVELNAIDVLAVGRTLLIHHAVPASLSLGYNGLARRQCIRYQHIAVGHRLYVLLGIRVVSILVRLVGLNLEIIVVS